MFRKSMRDAWGLFGLGIGLEIVFLPLTLLFHRKIQVWELLQDWWQGPAKLATLALIVAVVLGCWLVTTLVIYGFRWLNAKLREHDVY